MTAKNAPPVFVDYEDDGSLELKCPVCHEWHMRTEADAEDGWIYALSACPSCLDEDCP